MADDRQTLDDPDYARFAWKRYRRILKWMTLVALASVGAALGWLYLQRGELNLHIVIATTLGVGLTVFLAAALMGLVFLSSGTGHDEDVETPDLDR